MRLETYNKVDKVGIDDVSSHEVVVTRLGTWVDSSSLGRLASQALDGLDILALLLGAQGSPV